MPDPTPQEIKLQFLYNKYQNTATTNLTADYLYQGLGNARPRIIPSSQLYNQPIPDTPPTDLTEVAFNNDLAEKKQVSTTYPHIAKYTRIRLQIYDGGRSLWYKQADKNDPNGTNL